MTELHQDLAKAGVALAFIKVPLKHHVDLERMGLIDLIGTKRIFDSRHACVAAYQSEFLMGNGYSRAGGNTGVP